MLDWRERKKDIGCIPKCQVSYNDTTLKLNPERHRSASGAGQRLFDKACQYIPWGTQTNGKRPDPSFGDTTPYFIQQAEGCRMQDTEGRWYIDYRSALGPVLLGYRHPRVQEAVYKQLEKGVVFSLASPIELDVAERLIALIPGLEQVRFLKSGNEANLAAIRLARAYTGRDLIVTCGYHGHGDWFSCGTGEVAPWMWPQEGNGVPACLDALVIRIPYGDTEALKKVFSERGDEIAALIMVPHDWSDQDGREFVTSARSLTTDNGAVLIFDQVLTGFRLGLLGAQGYYTCIPDLTTYGKAIANGFPLAVFGGRTELMAMLDRVMITTTHAGEALSLAAALATLDVLNEEPVLDHIDQMGRRLMDGFDALSKGVNLPARSLGFPQAPQFKFSNDPLKQRIVQHTFFKALLEKGIFPSGIFLLSYAHKEADIDETLEGIDYALNAVVETGESDSMPL